MNDWYPLDIQLSKRVGSLEAITSCRLRNAFLDWRAAYSKGSVWICWAVLVLRKFSPFSKEFIAVYFPYLLQPEGYLLT